METNVYLVAFQEPDRRVMSIVRSDNPMTAIDIARENHPDMLVGTESIYLVSVGISREVATIMLPNDSYWALSIESFPVDVDE